MAGLNIMGSGKRDCNLDYGKSKGVIYIPSYQRIMSKKIRTFLIKKFLKSVLFNQEDKFYEELAENIVKRNPFNP